MQTNDEASEIIEHLKNKVAVLETQKTILTSCVSAVSDAVNPVYIQAHGPMGVLQELQSRALDALAKVAEASNPD